jgi:L-lactate dehydrogenase complex protein LldG
MAGAAMSGRETILAAIRSRRLAQTPKPAPYRAPPTAGDLPEIFAKKLSAQFADVRMLDSMADVPAAIADVLRGRNMAARIHIPPDSELAGLDLPNVEIRREAPGAFDAAVTVAPFAIAETGTLAYTAGKGTPASWHFRPVLEIAILRASSIVAELEDVLAALPGGLPSTLNLVSGPSRTGDIEQTMELGAHGPKALAVLVVRG